MDALAQLLPLIVIAALFWLLLIRPAQRRQRQALATQRAAGVGSEVMLTSGIFGTVRAADDEHLHLEIAPGTVVKVARGAVARVLDAEPSAPTHEVRDDDPTDAHGGQHGDSDSQ